MQNFNLVQIQEVTFNMYETEIQLVGERLLVTLYQNKCKKLKQRTQFYV